MIQMRPDVATASICGYMQCAFCAYALYALMSLFSAYNLNDSLCILRLLMCARYPMSRCCWLFFSSIHVECWEVFVRCIRFSLTVSLINFNANCVVFYATQNGLYMHSFINNYFAYVLLLHTANKITMRAICLFLVRRKVEKCTMYKFLQWIRLEFHRNI